MNLTGTVRAKAPSQFNLLATVKQRNNALLASIKADLKASRGRANESIRAILDHTSMAQMKREVGSLKATVTNELRKKDSALAVANANAHNAALELSKLTETQELIASQNQQKVEAALDEVDAHREQVETELNQLQNDLEKVYADKLAEVEAIDEKRKQETEEARAGLLKEGQHLEFLMDELVASEEAQKEEVAAKDAEMLATQDALADAQATIAALNKELVDAALTIGDREQALLEADEALAELPILGAALENAKKATTDADDRRRREVSDLQQQIGNVMSEKNAELHEMRATYDTKLAAAAEQLATKDALLLEAVAVAKAKDAEARRLQKEATAAAAAAAAAEAAAAKAAALAGSDSSPQRYKRVPIRRGSATRLVPIDDPAYN